jgi:hypothetical protein
VDNVVLGGLDSLFYHVVSHLAFVATATNTEVNEAVPHQHNDKDDQNEQRQHAGKGSWHLET